MANLNINDVIAEFEITGNLISAIPFGSGHINDTFKVTTDSGNQYMLQKINHFVFKDVEGLMANLVQVTNHLKQKLKATTGSDPEKEVLTLIKNKQGGYLIKDTDGEHWRVFVFLNDTKSYDQVLTEQQAFEGGKAFGCFQRLLTDLDTALIVDTIPNFHNIEYRLANLDKAIRENPLSRLQAVLPEVEFINERRTGMNRILQLGREGILPLRIIHYDTKFNNVLLDKNDKAQCVIDLDTVMQGFVAYDFGDAIRTIISTATEDDPDVNLINLNLPLFTAYANGYLEQTIGFLTEAEVHSLIDGVLLLPYMQTVRFLTDYLNGDTYYKIHSPHHNLQRTKAQMQLVKKLEEKRDELNGIILKSKIDLTTF
jgi:hypothetical protein